MKISLTLFGLVALLLLFASPVEAQFTGELFSVSLTPEHPKPGQTVTIEIESYSINLNSSAISWLVDGAVAKQGVGQKTFDVIAGKAGRSTNVRIVVNGNTGAYGEKTVVIRPADVDIVWEAASYTPPFYKGKAMHSFQSDVTFIAMPNLISGDGVRLSAKNVVYTWKRDGQVLGDSSGFGKQTLTLVANAIIKPMNVEVEVASQDGTVRAKNGVQVFPRSPELLLYEDQPLLGIRFERALEGTYALSGDEVKVAAFPFFTSSDERNSSSLNFRWSMNNRELTSSDSFITLRSERGQTGTAAITLTASHFKKFLQSATKSFTVQFGN